MPVVYDGDFYCPYCGAWINAHQVHEPNHHNDPDEYDKRSAKFPDELPESYAQYRAEQHAARNSR